MSKNNSLIIGVDDLSNKKLTLTITPSDSGTELIRQQNNANYDATQRITNLQARTRRTGVNSTIRAFLDDLAQRGVSSALPKLETAKKKPFSLRGWKRRFANAKSKKEKQELKKELLLSAFNDTYQENKVKT